VQPSIKYAVFATTAIVLLPIVITNTQLTKHLLNKNAVAYCDAIKEDESQSSLIQQADDAAEKAKTKIKVPAQFENIKIIIQQSGVNSYDGFRFQVQKQINLNTVVSHL
jgi:hypothetical protein